MREEIIMKDSIKSHHARSRVCNFNFFTLSISLAFSAPTWLLALYFRVFLSALSRQELRCHGARYGLKLFGFLVLLRYLRQRWAYFVRAKIKNTSATGLNLQLSGFNDHVQ